MKEEKYVNVLISLVIILYSLILIDSWFVHTLSELGLIKARVTVNFLMLITIYFKIKTFEK